MFRRYETIEDIYPLTIVRDRYNGTYSGGTFTAWRKYPDSIPSDIDDSDVPCMLFWNDFKGIVGKGYTIDEAVADLLRQLQEKKGTT